MKRWTNGLPGATKRLGAIMALRGLSASQPRMRADTHDGPEQIAPLQRPDTLMQLSRSSILEVHLVPHGRAIHFGTKQTYRVDSRLSAFGAKRTSRERRERADLTTMTQSGYERPRLLRCHGCNRPEKIKARYADASWFCTIMVRITKPAGSGAHFQLLSDGPGKEGPLGEN